MSPFSIGFLYPLWLRPPPTTQDLSLKTPSFSTFSQMIPWLSKMELVHQQIYTRWECWAFFFKILVSERKMASWSSIAEYHISVHTINSSLLSILQLHLYSCYKVKRQKKCLLLCWLHMLKLWPSKCEKQEEAIAYKALLFKKKDNVLFWKQNKSLPSLTTYKANQWTTMNFITVTSLYQCTSGIFCS